MNTLDEIKQILDDIVDRLNEYENDVSSENQPVKYEHTGAYYQSKSGKWRVKAWIDGEWCWFGTHGTKDNASYVADEMSRLVNWILDRR